MSRDVSALPSFFAANRWRSACRLKCGVSAVCCLFGTSPAKSRLPPAVAALMTLITVNAVVDIPGHVVVLEIVRIIAAMAASALEDGIVVRVDMAGRAHVVRVTVVGRELGVLRVIERGSGPGRRVVAGLARCREKLRLRGVARVRGVVVVGLVTTNAGCRQRRVVVVDMAVAADPRRHGVRAGQRKWRVVVVEGRVGPDRRVVAQLARSGEAGRGVRRIVRAGIVFLVARVAQRAVQGIVVVHVTVGALPRRNRVRARQREASGGVIELAVRPLNGVMTLLARGGEAGVRHRRGRVVVIGLMAADASGRQRGVVIVGMAIGARPRRHHVRSGQREGRVVVIEGRIRPEYGVVAKLARRREPGVRHRTGRIVEIRLVARNAERTLQAVVIADVAVDAGSRRHRMGTRQHKARGRVIELAIGPLHGVVTLLAGVGEAGVRHRSGRVREIGLVARNARGHGDAVVVGAVAIGARPRRHGV